MIAVPALASVVATWAASRNRPVILSIATLVVGLFVVVTGFSIGTAFLPAVGLLIWAITASVANGPAEQQSS
jgi:ABC-type branched-subunit amino acid transport system permease subunit